MIIRYFFQILIGLFVSTAAFPSSVAGYCGGRALEGATSCQELRRLTQIKVKNKKLEPQTGDPPKGWGLSRTK